ncbi:MAG: hypothetical protein IBX48_09665 [Thiomicrospira sp.]|uniref:hypothetical protein n=1 Tax=Thiomicrospira sp. TaxID=935 RepID=UPI0019F8E44E|nr:hypothetical protein [Thiomicrospira sp.]MBE0494593.1 hypothetical protein [Thiomicrospira sp.]
MAMTARQIQSDLTATNLTLDGQSIMLDQGWIDNAAGTPFSNAFGFGAVNVQAAITEALNWKSANTQLAEQQVIALDKVSYSTHNGLSAF